METNVGRKRLLHLRKKELFAESDNKIDVLCLKGRLWLTQPGDGRDRILEPGDHYLAHPAKGKLIVEALEESTVELRCQKES